MTKQKKESDLDVVALAQRIEGRRKKQRRTLFLSEEPFKKFQRYCDKRKVPLSEVVDEWIIKFVENVEI